MNQQTASIDVDTVLPNEVGSVLVANPQGLHARPAIQLTKLAMRFRSNVRVGATEQGPWVNAKSIARVMGMKTPSQRKLYFSADGDDAELAIRALIRLVESEFKAS